MTNHKPKLPARTPADTEALPDGIYRCWAECGTLVQILNGELFLLRPIPSPTSNAALASVVADVKGGITARLTDPAPLRELLEQVIENFDGMPMCAYQQATIDRIKAALEGNDG